MPALMLLTQTTLLRSALSRADSIAMKNTGYIKLIEQSRSTVDGDSNWLITLADVMTLLMVFFVMFLVAKQAESKKLPETASAAARLVDTQNQNRTRDTIVQSIKEMGMEKDVEVSLLDKDIVITLTENITFEPGKAEILDKSSPVIGKLAESIRSNPSYVVEINGHTDNVPIHTSRYPSNWELSESRAASVLKCFIDQYGVDPSRFYIRGCGDSKPLVSNDSPEQRTRNRRVEIRLKNNSTDN
jgi:chemotaxis protein MotB